MTFLSTDLDISQTELDQLTERLANSSHPDPIGDSISAQIQKVNDYTLRYELADDRTRRLLRALVLWDLYSRIGPVPSNIQNAYDDALDELKSIRDGKFPDLKPTATPSSDLAPARGAWGSETKIL